MEFEQRLGDGWTVYSYLDKESNQRKTVAHFILPEGMKLPSSGIGEDIARPVVNGINGVGTIFTNLLTGFRWGFDDYKYDSYSAMKWFLEYRNVYFEYSKPPDINLSK